VHTSFIAAQYLLDRDGETDDQVQCLHDETKMSPS